MADTPTTAVGRVTQIWTYPVKSLLGVQAGAAVLTPGGVLGDRAFALVDEETGRIASAKNPRRWPNLFAFRAAFTRPPVPESPLPPVHITLPDGRHVRTDEPDVDARLSAAAGRRVRLARSAIDGARTEGFWPEHDWLQRTPGVFEFDLAAGTFFDGAAVHLLTTATLRRLEDRAPASRFDVARFRPNFVIEPADGGAGFVEDAWIGRTLALGQARLRIDGPCPRCVMTILEQGDLPKDPAVLRTAVVENDSNVGVYASVVQPGAVRPGDAVMLL